MSLIDSVLGYLRGSEKKSAAVAKERLQIILAHERSGRSSPTPDYLPALREELVQVIAKYIPIDRDKIKVQLGKHGDYDVLELNVPLSERDRLS